MASFVFVRGVEDERPASEWKKSRYKSLAKWMAGTGATEELIRSDSRPGLTRYCYKLPDGRRVKLDVMDEDTVAMHSACDRALDSTIDYISNPNVPARWRAKALGDAIKAEKAMRKTG